MPELRVKEKGETSWQRYFHTHTANGAYDCCFSSIVGDVDVIIQFSKIRFTVSKENNPR